MIVQLQNDGFAEKHLLVTDASVDTGENQFASATWCSLLRLEVVTFPGRRSGGIFIGLEWNIPQHGFFGDDKPEIKRDIVRKTGRPLSMDHKLSEERDLICS